MPPPQEALERARQALKALENSAPLATLSAQIEGSGTLTITTYTDAAAWRPADARALSPRVAAGLGVVARVAVIRPA